MQPISKLWNHSWYIENGDFIVHWSKNTSFVTIWVTLWITAIYEEKTKEFYIILQHLKEFYHFIPKLVNKSHSFQWKFGQHFSKFETKICKTEMAGGFDTYESFKEWLHDWCEALLRAVIELKRLALKDQMWWDSMKAVLTGLSVAHWTPSPSGIKTDLNYLPCMR